MIHIKKVNLFLEDEQHEKLLKQKGNIVITAAPYPMDIDLYQSQKALDNGKLALEDDGVIILVSKCRDGVGEDAFLQLPYTHFLKQNRLPTTRVARQ